MTMQGQFNDIKSVERYMLAGNARLTVVNTATGNRLTYRVRRMPERDDGRAPGWFVSVLTGGNNDVDYAYLGCMWKSRDARVYAPKVGYVHGARSRIGPEAPSARGFAWLVRQVFRRRALPAGVEVWHDGRCGRCGRSLTVPESVATGLGPVCAAAEG